MPSPWLTRRLPIVPAAAILGVGLALGTAQPAVAESAPVAKVIARGERDVVVDPPSTSREPLLLLVALSGLVIGAGGLIADRLVRPVKQ